MRHILKKILEQSADRADDWQPPVGVLRDAWSGLVGDKLAAVTRPATVDWDQGRLVVEAASDAWQRELRRHDAELLDRLGQVLPWRLETLEVETGMIPGDERSPDEPSDAATPYAMGEADEPDPTSDPVEAPDDVESSLDELGSGTASSARRILGHVRDEDE